VWEREFILAVRHLLSNRVYDSQVYLKGRTTVTVLIILLRCDASEAER
jgi:hypothetical protein